MRIRLLAVPTGIALVVMAGVASPSYAATAHHAHQSGHHRSATVSGADDSTGSSDGSGDSSSTSTGFGTVTSYDASTGQLVVATSDGGSVAATVTARTRLALLSVSAPSSGPVAHRHGGHPGDGADPAQDTGGGQTRAQRRTAALAALVAGATVQRLQLDPRTGALRSLLIQPASTTSADDSSD